MVIEVSRGVEVARLNGEDFRNPARLDDIFQELISRTRQGRLVIDLSDVETTMSLGIAVLVAAQGLALIHKTELVFASMSRNMAKLLAATGADKVLKLLDSVDAAVDSFAARA